MKYFFSIVLSAFFANAVAQNNVGIGTSNPVARLHVADGSVLFTAPAVLPVNAGNTPANGAGYRMMWYAGKAALRMGRTTGNQSDGPQIGLLSVAAGQDNLVPGFASAAFGMDNIALSGYNFTAGFGNEARSVTAAALGFNNIVKAQHGFVVGLHNDTTDIAFGDIANAGDRLFQIGNGSSTTNRSNAITVLRNGNMGIGTASPNAPLQFSNTAQNRKIVLFEDADNEHQFYGFGINGSTLRYQTPATGDDHVFFSGINLTSSKELMRIKGNGNTGIGINNPTYKLEVAGNVGIANTSGVATLAFNGLGVSNFITSFDDGSFIINNSFDGNIFNYQTGSQRIQIDKSLDITSFGSAPNLTINNFNDTARVRFANPMIFNSGRSWQLKSFTGVSFGTSDADIFAISNSGIGNVLSAKGNGNIGIGVDDAQFKLDVNGRVRIRSTPGLSAGTWLNNDANTSSNAFVGMRSDTEVGFYGQTGTPNWRFYVNTTNGNATLQGMLTQNSDARLKKDIRPLTNTLQNIQQLSGYQYHWKDNQRDSTAQIGLLAQEVQKIYPQLVKEDSNGTLSVNYSGMVPVLLEAIKEQQVQLANQLKILELQNERIGKLEELLKKNKK